MTNKMPDKAKEDLYLTINGQNDVQKLNTEELYE